MLIYYVLKHIFICIYVCALGTVFASSHIRVSDHYSGCKKLINKDLSMHHFIVITMTRRTMFV